MKTNHTTFIALLVLLIMACSDIREQEMSHEEMLNSVKTITTSFVSHQSDTQHKDDKIIAVARFYPDGTMEEMTKYMTYPYNFKDPKEKKFWTSPIRVNVPFVMDGLDFGTSEWNLLYGNDWPKAYLEFAKSGRFPNRQIPFEFRIGNSPKVEMNDDQLPTLIEMTPDDPRNGVDGISYMHTGVSNKFDYLDGKISRFGSKAVRQKGPSGFMGKRNSTIGGSEKKCNQRRKK